MSVLGFLSGVESKQHFNHCVEAGVRNVLMSYWQFWKQDVDLVAKRKRQHPTMNFMVDSGAFTFLTEMDKFASWTREQYSHYVESYAAWLQRNQEYLFSAVEYDADPTINKNLGGSLTSQIGSNMVREWQQRLFEPLQEKGLPIVFVWHENRGMEGWEDMCRQYPYVGMPGVFSSEPDRINRHVSVARRYATAIHGFAATKQLDFRDIPWKTVDSITWKTGEMYGTLIVWDERAQQLIFEDDKTRRAVYRPIIEASGFNADAIINQTSYQELTRFCLWSMQRMEAFYQERFSYRVPYHAVRVPPVAKVKQFTSQEVKKVWSTLKARDVFPQHRTATVREARHYLAALSQAMSGKLSALQADAKATTFLGTYFPRLIYPFTTDAAVLQREVVAHVLPRNPPPLPRTSLDHFSGLASREIRERPTQFALDFSVEVETPNDYWQ